MFVSEDAPDMLLKFSAGDDVMVETTLSSATEGGLVESVSLSVMVRGTSNMTIADLQKAAFGRASEILRA